MNKLRLILLVSALASISASALAEDIDMKPLAGMSWRIQPVDATDW